MAAENLPIKITITALDASRGALRGVAAGLKSVSAAAFSMRTALIAAGAAGGMGLLIRQSLNATDALAKTASRIGTTTAELQKLQFASELSGLNIETTNMALQRFSRRAAEAARGTGEAQGVIRELGLDARELAKAPLSDAMLMLADAFESVEGGTQQLRIAFKLFDSEGAGFVTMLNQGSAALRELFNEAEGLGFILSASAVQGVEQTNDALTKLGFVLAGIRDQFTAVLAPAIQFVTDKLTTFITANVNAKGSLETFAREAIADFLVGLANATQGIAVITGAISTFGNYIIELLNGISAAINTFFDLKDSLSNIEFRFGNTSVRMQEFTEFLRQLAEQTRNATGVEEDFNKELDKTPNLFQRISDAMQLAVNQIPTIDQLMTNFSTGAMNTFTQAFTDAVTGAKSFADAVKDMARSVINSLIKMLVQYYITKPLFEAITGFVGGLGGGGAGTRNVGGPVSRGRPYIVGESGPELFVPSSSGQVVPNGRMGSGATVHQTINISTGVAQTVRAEVLNLMPQIAESAKAAVQDSRLRGGGFSKAMMGA